MLKIRSGPIRRNNLKIDKKAAEVNDSSVNGILRVKPSVAIHLGVFSWISMCKIKYGINTEAEAITDLKIPFLFIKSYIKITGRKSNGVSRFNIPIKSKTQTVEKEFL